MALSGGVSAALCLPATPRPPGPHGRSPPQAQPKHNTQRRTVHRHLPTLGAYCVQHADLLPPLNHRQGQRVKSDPIAKLMLGLMGRIAGFERSTI